MRGWDYVNLVKTYLEAERGSPTTCARAHSRNNHHTAGHCPSGSHERYKSPERLHWEEEFDGVTRSKWLLDNHLATEPELQAIENDARLHIETTRAQAWETLPEPIKAEIPNSGH